MNRFIKSSLLVGALLTVTGVSFSAPAQADNNQKYLDNLAVQMYANNVAHGMSPLTGGIYSPYVNGAIYGQNNFNNGRHRHRHRNNYLNNQYLNNGYYNNNYGYQPYGYGTGYYGNGRPSIFSQLINGFGY
ncbi:MAG: hypothetical protein JST89_25725 [Cyanobacteria bacterium SZAS-4]|nr:hypothetical protein [Cyanobacteria bacterium SZAS-4]